MSSTLTDFSKKEAPVIQERTWVNHPVRKQRILGALGSCNRDHPAFIAQRTRWKEGNEVQDYYRNIGGYSLVESTVEKLQAKGVKTIFIEETDNNQFVEYDTATFKKQGEQLEDWQGEQQICCATEWATHTWATSDVTIDRMKR